MIQLGVFVSITSLSTGLVNDATFASISASPKPCERSSSRYSLLAADKLKPNPRLSAPAEALGFDQTAPESQQ